MRYNLKFGVKIKVSILLAVALILVHFRIGIPIFPNFLDFDLSDIPVFFMALYFSPLLGVFAMALKNIFTVLTIGSFTYGVGEFANFLIGASFIFTVSVIFNRVKGRSRYVLSYVIGTLVLLSVGFLANYFIILPIYLKVLGVSIESIIGEGTTILKFLIVYIVPYNLIKSIIIFAPTVCIFSRIKKINSRSDS